MLAMARALIQQPKVLLVDELSMGLAPHVAEALFDTVRRIATDHGSAVVLVEQHVNLALEVADTAAVLNHGTIVLRGPATELANDTKRLERTYLGTLGTSGRGLTSCLRSESRRAQGAEWELRARHGLRTSSTSCSWLTRTMDQR
ncbi:ATP-binding cassette domain-containing protein [Frankia sp. Hr75.2]|nr:ATP-binding cassette domain-containing protein [Frankia sp. Hr75.2]SQE00154.1 hypothetical protein FMEAI12_6190002 [Parafrankia sp. Ea1.12]